MNCSTPGLPVHHQLPDFTQTHMYRVSDAIQPSHPLSSTSPPAPPSIRVFSSESTLCMRWPKYWSFSFSIIPSKEMPGLISFRMDYYYIWRRKWQPTSVPCLENPMDRGVWQAPVHGVARVRHDLATKPPAPPLLHHSSSFIN